MVLCLHKLLMCMYIYATSKQREMCAFSIEWVLLQGSHTFRLRCDFKADSKPLERHFIARGM